MSDGRQAIESNPSQAFSGLCQFIDWWTNFQRLHCEGIDWTWSASSFYLVTFRFQKGTMLFNYTLDLKDPNISQAMFKLQVNLLKLQQAPSIKTNESES